MSKMPEVFCMKTLIDHNPAEEMPSSLALAEPIDAKT